MKTLCVYCSSSSRLDKKYYDAAEALGIGLAQHGWALVYGGGKAGLMGSVARSAKTAGGYVIGVIPEFMKARELAFTDADELITVTTMHERKQIMAEKADAFVTLPGGIGTLEELSEIMTARYLNLMTKPIILVNQDGFYDDLLRFFDKMIQEKFKSAGMSDIVTVAKTVEEVWTVLQNPRPYQADAFWRM